MQKTIVGFVLLLVAFLSLPIQAQDLSVWKQVASSDSGNVYYLKKDSVRVLKKDHTYLIIGIVQIQKTTLKEVIYNKVAMLGQDCVAGFGSVLVSNVDDNNFVKIPYVSEGNSIGSGVGDALCNWPVRDQDVLDLDASSDSTTNFDSTPNSGP